MRPRDPDTGELVHPECGRPWSEHGHKAVRVETTGAKGATIRSLTYQRTCPGAADHQPPHQPWRT